MSKSSSSPSSVQSLGSYERSTTHGVKHPILNIVTFLLPVQLAAKATATEKHCDSCRQFQHTSTSQLRKENVPGAYEYRRHSKAGGNGFFGALAGAVLGDPICGATL
mmetsp:Transcript_34997/g.76553  ORF Transcript_34997/g.76553 Transcript_34997/m.76553 type:complete len:107 (-) Transcript_34997:88-408(-)|eukprot:CAMPEP_0178490910 /NCGR_PEP_ID=MMETSP0696-20121128/11134_1 /TAXON_ID=265572 /ORGANISM="Extubocellulus spinifer, Strain CCMP396" /LENGTH=106 /DNA_ID=CAMNT_0020118755 /DNA_START=35 /DNA_END=355 /DNA_ORIENTATION=-